MPQDLSKWKNLNLNSSGSRGPQPPYPNFFFNHAVFRQLWGKAPILSKFWAQAPPPWGQNFAGPPDQNPGSAPAQGLLSAIDFDRLDLGPCCYNKTHPFVQSLSLANCASNKNYFQKIYSNAINQEYSIHHVSTLSLTYHKKRLIFADFYFYGVWLPGIRWSTSIYCSCANTLNASQKDQVYSPLSCVRCMSASHAQ